MKNSITHILLLTLFTILSAGSCKKECTDPICQLPPATQTGANTMGCLINGKPWLPDTRDNGSMPRLMPISVSLWQTPTQLYCRFYRQRDPDNQAVRIFIKNFVGVGTYIMDSTSSLIGFPGTTGVLKNHFNFSELNTRMEYVTNVTYKGEVTITTYNEVLRIVSGTFSFKAQNINATADSVVISNGRFDSKM